MKKPRLSNQTIGFVLPLCLPLGILLGLMFPRFEFPFFHACFGACLLLSAIGLPRAPRAVSYLLCLLALGLGQHHAAECGRRTQALLPGPGDLDRLYRVVGRIRQVLPTRYGFSIHLEQVRLLRREQLCFERENLILYAPSDTPEPEPGSEIRAWATLKRKSEPRTFPWPIRALRRQYFPNLFASVKSASLLELEALRRPPSPLSRANRELMGALLRNQFSPIWSERLKPFGVGHLLSISGLHCGLIYLAFQILLFPFRQAYLRAALSIAALLAFADWMNWSAAVGRSTLLLSFWVLLPLLNRPKDWMRLWTGLLLAALLLDPMQMLSRGFWYTYVASLGLLLGNRPWALATPLEHPLLRRFRPLLPLVSAQLLVIPINLLFDCETQLLSVFWNFLGLAFLFCLALLLLLSLAGLYWTGLAPAANHLDAGFMQLLELLDFQHPLWVLHRFPFPLFLSFWIVTALIAALQFGRSEWRWYIAIGGLLGALALNRPMPAGRLWMLDVGQGLSLLHVDHKGRGHFFDAGGSLPGGVRLESVAKLYGARSVETLVISHPHSDHYDLLSGLDGSPQLWGNWDVAEAKEKIAELKDRKVRVPKTGQRLVIGNLEVWVLGPGPAKAPNLNEGSLTLLLRTPEWELLFAADAGIWAEPDWSLPAKSRRRFLQVGHHGSKTATGEALIQGFRPDVAMISCGEDNSFDHPHPDVLRRLTRAGVKVEITALSGSREIGRVERIEEKKTEVLRLKSSPD